MNSTEQTPKRDIVLERALLISPTSLTSEIPESEASQGVTIEMLRELANPTTPSQLQKALELLGIKRP